MLFAKVSVIAIGVIAFMLGTLILGWLIDAYVIHQTPMINEDQALVAAAIPFALFMLAFGAGLVWLARAKMPLGESRTPNVFD